MYRSLLILFILVGFIPFCNAQNVDSILFKAYDAGTEKESLREFAKAKYFVTNSDQEASYMYFKYFYQYKINHQDSLKYYEEKALPILKKTEAWTQYFQLRNNRYFIIEESGASEKAIKFAKQILAEATEIDNYENMALMHARMGNSFHNISFFEKGIKQAQTGYELALKHIPEDELVQSELLNIIAINFDDWGKADSAIYYHRKVIALQKLDDMDKISTFNNIGNTYLKMNFLDSADTYISRALSLSIENPDPYHQATAYNNKADILLRKGSFSRSKSLLDSALKYSTISGALEKKRDVHETWNRYYLALDSTSLAMKHLTLFHAYKDSMVNTEKLHSIEKIEKEELELKQKEALGKRNIWIVIAVAAVIILLILLRQLAQKKKRQEKDAQLQIQQERLRISRDLHDNIGAELSYMSSLIDQKLYSEEDEEKRAELSELGDSSKSAMNQLRETIWAIQTEEITLEKFHDKLNQLSRRYSENLQIDVLISTDGLNHLLNPAQAINIFRICQEAINNAFKYAKDQKVNVFIRGESDFITVIVEDNGIGFDPENVKAGYGLNNMKERAAQMKGTLLIASTISKGTKITLRVPV